MVAKITDLPNINESELVNDILTKYIALHKVYNSRLVHLTYDYLCAEYNRLKNIHCKHTTIFEA